MESILPSKRFESGHDGWLKPFARCVPKPSSPDQVWSRGRQRYGNTFSGSGIKFFCGTVFRYKFLELAENGIGSGTHFRTKRYAVTLKVLHFALKIQRNYNLVQFLQISFILRVMGTFADPWAAFSGKFLGFRASDYCVPFLTRKRSIGGNTVSENLDKRLVRIINLP